MISRLKDKNPHRLEVITQNIDDLLERANCKDVIYLHGFLKELKCMSCEEIVNIEYENQTKENSTCSSCGGKLRPNVVFFGEAAPMYEVLYKHLQECIMLVVIGTSGNVIDVNHLSSFASYSILNNLEPSSVIYEENFDKLYYEDANTAYEKVEQDIEEYIKKYIED